MPSSRQRATSASSLPDVSIMMVAPANSGVALIRSASMKPSISGIRASSNTSGKGSPIRWACSRAARAASSAVNRRRLHLPTVQHLDEDLSVDVVIIHHQHRQAVQLFTARRHQPHGNTIRNAEVRREVEGAAFSDLAFNPNPASQHLYQPARDRQPQTCAPVFPSGGPVDLLECREDGLLFLCRDADARVGHGEMQEDRGWRMEDGGWRMEDGGWRMEDGGWRMEDGGWRMEDGGWRMEDGGWRRNRSSILYPRFSIL